MTSNRSLNKARLAKNDESYTRWGDIEREMNAYVSFDPDVFRDKTILLPCDDPEWSQSTRYFVVNFNRLGLKKLMSTSYAPGLRTKAPTIMELLSSSYDASKHEKHGRLFVLDRDMVGDEEYPDPDSPGWTYLAGGAFEVKR